jgi:hypothetical protein
MPVLLSLLRILRLLILTRAALPLEILALRHQLNLRTKGVHLQHAHEQCARTREFDEPLKSAGVCPMVQEIDHADQFALTLAEVG